MIALLADINKHFFVEIIDNWQVIKTNELIVFILCSMVFGCHCYHLVVIIIMLFNNTI